MQDLDENFWNEKYKNNDTGWDMQMVSPPLKEYIDQIENKTIKILIPGCGNAHEADYLVQNGFTNITLLDIAEEAVNNLKNKYKNFPSIKIIKGDFFTHPYKYDLILEQTFFCAINPNLRESYINKSSELLYENGKLAGVLFNTQFEKQGPPFGGSSSEYLNLFKTKFNVKKLEPCINSHPKRMGNEVFFIVQKK